MDSTHDPARVLHIPGSVNTKENLPPIPCEFVNEYGTRYRVEELAAVVEPEESEGEEKRHPSDNASSALKLTASAGGCSAAERCRRYVGKMPPAISRRRGHDACFDVARTIFVGFALSESEGRPILYEYNARCQPPWSDKELAHKIDEAIHKSRLPPGYLLDKSPSAKGGRRAGRESRVARPALPAHLGLDRPPSQPRPGPRAPPHPG
jgi:hypothetical protein